MWIKLPGVTGSSRLADVEEWVHPEDVGPPRYFISHAWKGRWLKLLSTVEDFLSNASGVGVGVGLRLGMVGVGLGVGVGVGCGSLWVGVGVGVWEWGCGSGGVGVGGWGVSSHILFNLLF